MYWAFLAIVIWTCVNHFITETHDVNDKRILSEKGLICFCQIAIYLIFEWVAEFLYCLKRPEYSAWIKVEGNDYLQLFWKSIKSYFGHKIDLSKIYKPVFFIDDNDENSMTDSTSSHKENVKINEKNQNNSINGLNNQHKKVPRDKILKEVVEKHGLKK